MMIRSDIDSEYGYQRKLAFMQYKEERQRLDLNENQESKEELKKSHMDDLDAFKREVSRQIHRMKKNKMMDSIFSFQKIIKLQDNNVIQVEDDVVIDAEQSASKKAHD